VTGQFSAVSEAGGGDMKKELEPVAEILHA